MKRRPRRIESEVAKHLSKEFAKLKLDPVERVPVIGRTGPDISINQSKLAIDVKSRLEVPKAMWKFKRLGKFGDLLAVRICEFERILSDVPRLEAPLPKTVKAYMDHMAEWSSDHIPAIVVHRPGMWVANAIFLIREADRERFIQNIPKFVMEEKWHEDVTQPK